MREKILEKPINIPLKLVRRNINKRLRETEKEYHTKVNEFKINYQWVDCNKLMMKSNKFPVEGALLLSQDKLVVYADIPFYLMPFAAVFKEKYVKILENEIDKLISGEGNNGAE